MQPKRDAMCMARPLRALAFIAFLFVSLACPASRTLALQPIVLGEGDEKIDITYQGEFYERRGDKLNVEMAPNAEGIVGRMTA